MKVRLLFQLFTVFFKIGAIAFGGGYAVIPLLQRDVVLSRKWISSEEFADIMAISQTLPGAIMVNASTMLGYRLCGLPGAVIATTASIAPTFIITILAVVFLWNYTDNPWIRKAFTGILLGVSALVISSITNMRKSAVKDRFDILFAILSAALLILFKLSAVLVIMVIAAAGFTKNLIVFKTGMEKK